MLATAARTKKPVFFRENGFLPARWLGPEGSARPIDQGPAGRLRRRDAVADVAAIAAAEEVRLGQGGPGRRGGQPGGEERALVPSRRGDERGDLRVPVGKERIAVARV